MRATVWRQMVRRGLLPGTRIQRVTDRNELPATNPADCGNEVRRVVARPAAHRRLRRKMGRQLARLYGHAPRIRNRSGVARAGGETARTRAFRMAYHVASRLCAR